MARRLLLYELECAIKVSPPARLSEMLEAEELEEPLRLKPLESQSMLFLPLRPGGAGPLGDEGTDPPMFWRALLIGFLLSWAC